MTIHKSQGKTFDQVAIDLGRGAFAPGQLYVALSRCRSLQGIHLKKEIKKSDIRVDWRVVKFIAACRQEPGTETSGDHKLDLINKALAEGSLLKIVYLNSKGEKTERLVKPDCAKEMAYRGRTFLGMRAYCHTRESLRTFRVDRILDIRMADEPLL